MFNESQCPVCHSPHIHVAEWYSDSGETEYYCVCDDCNFEDPDRFTEPYVAVDHWSRRVVTGYVGGTDPTDTEYDQLDDNDLAMSSFDVEDDHEESVVDNECG